MFHRRNISSNVGLPPSQRYGVRYNASHNNDMTWPPKNKNRRLQGRTESKRGRQDLRPGIRKERIEGPIDKRPLEQQKAQHKRPTESKAP